MGLSRHQNPRQEGTYHVKATKWRPALKVTADGKGLATHAGSRLLAEMADRSGLTDALSEALAPMCKRRRRHDPGKVISDLAVTIAGGGDALANLLGLRLQADVFGAVASVPTAFRVIDAIDDTLLAAIRAARSKVRRSVWGAGLNPVTEHGYVTLDFDATLLDAHSDKQYAAPTYKKGYGFFPLGTWLDNTSEALAGILRPGNAGANTAADHIEVLDLALAQLPVAPRGIDPVNGVAMLARADSAGCTHEFLNALRRYGIEYSVGFDVTEAVQVAILDVPPDAWVEAIDQDCALRGGAGVAELTDLLDLSAWPVGTRAICRREGPHPLCQGHGAAQPSLLRICQQRRVDRGGGHRPGSPRLDPGPVPVRQAGQSRAQGPAVHGPAHGRAPGAGRRRQQPSPRGGLALGTGAGPGLRHAARPLLRHLIPPS